MTGSTLGKDDLRNLFTRKLLMLTVDVDEIFSKITREDKDNLKLVAESTQSMKTFLANELVNKAKRKKKESTDEGSGGVTKKMD